MEHMAHKIMVVNGPNINLLGYREKSIYGKVSMQDINKNLEKIAEKHQVSIDFFQSNHEGEIVDQLQHAKIYVNIQTTNMFFFSLGIELVFYI